MPTCKGGPMPWSKSVPAFGTIVVAAVVALAAQKTETVMAPVFEVDPFWPKPLPNHWVTGSTIGLSVDANDNVWTIHRPETVEANFKAAHFTVADAVDNEAAVSAPGTVNKTDRIGACCKVAPPVLVYD